MSFRHIRGLNRPSTTLQLHYMYSLGSLATLLMALSDRQEDLPRRHSQATDVNLFVEKYVSSLLATVYTKTLHSELAYSCCIPESDRAICCADSDEMQKLPSRQKRQSRQEIQRRVVDGLDKLFDQSTELTLYLRACERLLREGEVSQAEKDHEQAYTILLRLVELIVTYIPRHPKARDTMYATKVKRLTRQVPSLMNTLAELKPHVDAEYEQYRKQQRADSEAKARLEAATRAKRKELEFSHGSNLRHNGNQSLKGKPDLRAVRQQLDALNISDLGTVTSAEATRARTPTTYDYPMLDQHEKEIVVEKTDGDVRSTVPVRPPKIRVPSESRAVSKVLEPNLTISEDRQFSSYAHLENDEPLKTLFVPSTLRAAFLKLAQANTNRNLETCGILSGVLRNNAYFITTLIIPAQASTSDTCHTTDEEALFTYQDSHDLFTLGWIHTHPTQTCFLSSVDLHTHCSYQLMLPESIAIVCSPSKTPSWGVFRLTDPPGVRVVKNCQQQGLFHPHAEEHIYVAASKDANGHVRELDGMTFSIEDQREDRA